MEQIGHKCDRYHLFYVIYESIEKSYKKIIMKVTSAALFISIALVVFGISYYYFTTRHRERMTILQKGLPKDYFKGNTNYLPLVLTLGILCIGIALGVVAGGLLNFIEIGGIRNLMFPFAILLFMGISLLVSYSVIKKIQNKNV